MCILCVCAPKHSSTQLAETKGLVLLGSGCLQNEHFQCSFPAWFFEFFVGISERGRSMVLCKTEITLFIWV